VRVAKPINSERELGKALGLTDEDFSLVDNLNLEETDKRKNEIIKYWIQSDVSSSIERIQSVVDHLKGMKNKIISSTSCLGPKNYRKQKSPRIS